MYKTSKKWQREFRCKIFNIVRNSNKYSQRKGDSALARNTCLQKETKKQIENIYVLLKWHLGGNKMVIRPNENVFSIKINPYSIHDAPALNSKRCFRFVSFSKASWWMKIYWIPRGLGRLDVF